MPNSLTRSGSRAGRRAAPRRTRSGPPPRHLRTQPPPGSPTPGSRRAAGRYLRPAPHRLLYEGDVLGDGPCADLELDAPVTCVSHASRLCQYIYGRSREQPVYRHHRPRRRLTPVQAESPGRGRVQVPDGQLEPEPDGRCRRGPAHLQILCRVHPFTGNFATHHRAGEPA